VTREKHIRLAREEKFPFLMIAGGWLDSQRKGKNEKSMEGAGGVGSSFLKTSSLAGGPCACFRRKKRIAPGQVKN